MPTVNNEASSGDRVHHPYSPSSLQLREACPKFQQREGAANEAAILGTKQHNAVEDPSVDNPELSDYRIAAVQQCLEFAEERRRHFPNCTVLREVYLPIDDEKITDPDGKVFLGTTAGYLDYGIISEDQTRAEVLDWKFGQNIVEPAKTNLQGISYVLGLLRKFPALQEVTMRFIMPHADHTSEYTFTRDEFDQLRLRVHVAVRRSVEAAKNPDDFSMARANISSCLFCGLIGKCPKVFDFAGKVGHKYRPLEIPAQVTPSLVRDAKDVGIGLRLAAVMATWSEAFRRQATARTIEHPDFVPDGYTIVQSQRRSVVRAKSLADLAKQFIPSDKHHLVEELYDVPLGKLEELVSTFAERGQKDKTVELFGEKAIEAGVIKLGQPFAYLKQDQTTNKQ